MIIYTFQDWVKRKIYNSLDCFLLEFTGTVDRGGTDVDNGSGIVQNNIDNFVLHVSVDSNTFSKSHQKNIWHDYVVA